VPFTSGFATSIKLTEHFGLHGSEFGATTEDEYLLLADVFLGGPLTPGTLEGRRKANGDRVRYSPITDEFGTLTVAGVIRTYFRPDPALHGFLTNLDYFKDMCK
jgi:filamentous hemagglutinin